MKLGTRRKTAVLLVAFSAFIASAGAAAEPLFKRSLSAELDGDPAVVPPEVREAVKKAQEHLKRTQRDDGSIGTHVASTALAVLGWMVDGSTPGHGPYGKEIAKGMRYLLSQAKPTGLIASGPGGPMYHHGLATLCLAELWGMTGDPDIRQTLQKAIDLIVRCQNPEGGWRYEPHPMDADLSVTVMQIVALRAAENGGIAVPEKTVTEAIRFVKGCHTGPAKGFAYTYTGGGKGTPYIARSAAGVIALQLCGEYESKEVSAGLEYLWGQRDKLDSIPKYPFYAHYYAMQAMYQARDSEKWNEWYRKSCKVLMAKQEKDGSFPASYDTGMAILALGLPYRYLPIYQR